MEPPVTTVPAPEPDQPGRADQPLEPADPSGTARHPATPVGGDQVDLLVVTGLSGAGRSTVAHALEDLGWYVVDNLPPSMLGALSGLVARAGSAVPRIAVVLDVRTRGLVDPSAGGPAARTGGDLADVLLRADDAGVRRRLLFLEASDDVLVRRFESVRRPHPLQEEGRVLDGIVAEREMLRDLRAAADVVIDTSDRNVHQLGATIGDLFGSDERTRLRLTLVSFGFKYGLPTDADHVVDVRFLPNPFWVPELRGHTGREGPVADYVLGQEGAEEFCRRYASALEPVIAGYRRENRSYVTVAVGCTGGKHRSVAVSERLAELLSASTSTPTVVVDPDGATGTSLDVPGGARPVVGATVRVVHRDLGRE